MGEIVFQQNKEVLTSSLIVAEVFGKPHKTVLRSIANLGKSLDDLETSAQKCADLFMVSSYEDEYGRNQEMYLMDKDGFILLAMGFSGVKALRFKLAFIGAFNKMQKELARINQENAKDLKAQLSRANFLLTRGSNQLKHKLSYDSFESVTTSDIICYVGVSEACLYEAFAYLGIILMIDGVWYVNDRLGVGSMVKETFTDHFGIKRDNIHILWNPIHKQDILALSQAIYEVEKMMSKGKDKYSESGLCRAFEDYHKFNRKIPVSWTQMKMIGRLLAEVLYK